jgi:hypothetical protein
MPVFAQHRAFALADEAKVQLGMPARRMLRLRYGKARGHGQIIRESQGGGEYAGMRRTQPAKKKQISKRHALCFRNYSVRLVAMLIKPIELEINPDAPFDNDAFDRKDVVEALVTLIGRISGPYVIAIDAPWGSGKTTFLRMLSACLRKQTHPCLEFNAWETDFADDPLIAFVGELDRLVRDISPDEAERNELWNKTKRTAASVAKRAVPAAVSQKLPHLVRLICMVILKKLSPIPLARLHQMPLIAIWLIKN